ncbi:hypothetical protein ROJ8625_01701 [Roseivivax jejudonensis]|uniref:Uncharacterized protein n=1 Tax=Roseivivax jejudonensis TaxID=1529041 RepID=A0A1X6Z168_9RHOB|nr:hypothetical protein [Roseivivax jejudonensis]SLN37323.1 hypothetical protein ROJ8625_01701 [Roseivivax jejudonensis]
MNLHWLMRMRRWAQNPPSWKMVKFVFAIIAICAALFSVERYVGLPEWMNAAPRGPMRLP